MTPSPTRGWVLGFWRGRTACVACQHDPGTPHLDGTTLAAEWAFHYWTTHGWHPEEVAGWIEDTIRRRPRLGEVA